MASVPQCPSLPSSLLRFSLARSESNSKGSLKDRYLTNTPTHGLPPLAPTVADTSWSGLGPWEGARARIATSLCQSPQLSSSTAPDNAIMLGGRIGVGGSNQIIGSSDKRKITCSPSQFPPSGPPPPPLRAIPGVNAKSHKRTDYVGTSSTPCRPMWLACRPPGVRARTGSHFHIGAPVM